MNSPVQQLANLIANETNGMSASDLDWHPQGKWSVAEILEHLSLTYSGTKIVFDRCLQAGKPSATRATAKERLRAFVVTRGGYMAGGFQAPKGAIPRGLRPEAVVSAIANNLSAMEESIRQCEKHFGRNVKLVNHPILGPLTAAEWRKFHCVHGRHHLRQIRRLRKLIESNNKQP